MNHQAASLVINNQYHILCIKIRHSQPTQVTIYHIQPTLVKGFGSRVLMQLRVISQIMLE